MSLNGSTPQINDVGRGLGLVPLFHSNREVALIKDKTIKPGYGVLRSGTLMAVATGNLDLVPYVETAAYTNNGNGKTYVVANAIATESTVQILNSAAKKLTVGESLIICADSIAAENLGAIVSVVEGVNGIAVVTVTTAISAETGFTSAANTHVYLSSAAATPWTKAVYVLDQDVDTGSGTDALGANTSVVISNAILYTSALVNLDAAASTDLGSITDGNHTILK